MKANGLFLGAMALGNAPELDEGLRVWGAFCDAAESEIAAPTAFTDVAGLASMAASGRLRRGDYYEMSGDHGAAASERDRAAVLIAAHGCEQAQIEVRRTLANSFKYQGRYGQALTELAAVEAQLELANVQVDQAMLFEWLADFERAEALLARVEASLASEFENLPPMQSLAATLLAGLLDPEGVPRRTDLQTVRSDLRQTRMMAARRSERVRDAWDHLIAYQQDAGAVGVEAALDYHEMSLQILQGHFHAALHRFPDLDAAFREHALLRTKLPALHRLGAMAGIERAPRWSLTLVQNAMAMAERTADYEVLWQLQSTAAEAHAALGDARAASEAWLNAARTADQLRRVPIGYRLESTYFADRRPMFAQSVAHAAEHGHADAALELTELAKSRSLATLIYGDSGMWQVESHQSPVVQQIDDLSRRIDAWDMKRYSQQDPDRTEREQLIAERAHRIEQMRAADPRWRSLTERTPVDLDAIVACDAVLARADDLRNQHC